jgi:hypothetical protein
MKPVVLCILDGWGINGNKDNPEDWQGEGVASTRGWGCFQYYENGEELQDAFMDFITEALNDLCKKKGIPFEQRSGDQN